VSSEKRLKSPRIEIHCARVASALDVLLRLVERLATGRSIALSVRSLGRGQDIAQLLRLITAALRGRWVALRLGTNVRWRRGLIADCRVPGGGGARIGVSPALGTSLGVALTLPLFEDTVVFVGPDPASAVLMDFSI
jgi:hypothetical protein